MTRFLIKNRIECGKFFEAIEFNDIERYDKYLIVDPRFGVDKNSEIAPQFSDGSVFFQIFNAVDNNLESQGIEYHSNIFEYERIAAFEYSICIFFSLDTKVITFWDAAEFALILIDKDRSFIHSDWKAKSIRDGLFSSPALSDRRYEIYNEIRDHFGIREI